jgi:hypothetical protein
MNVSSGVHRCLGDSAAEGSQAGSRHAHRYQLERASPKIVDHRAGLCRRGEDGQCQLRTAWTLLRQPAFPPSPPLLPTAVSHPALSGARDDSELLEKAQRIHHDPLLGDLAAVQPEDLYRLEPDLTPSRWHADELAPVRTPHKNPYGHEIILSNELFGPHMEIREGAQHPSDELQLRCGSIHIRQIGVVPKVIRRQ